jgi:hypothetical protein
MSLIAQAPFNIELLLPTDSDVRGMRPVKVLDINDGFSKNFHPDGLFSTETFGKVGEERRNRLFSYINMHISVFHPVIYKALLDLKSLYGDIIAGTGYAVFDPETNDFEKSDVTQGETGFAFFVKHFEKIKFESRPSAKREFNIAVVNKYRTNCLMDKLVVMPAGLRDYTLDENNKPSEDEINGLYRRVLSVAGIIENVNAKSNIEYLDSTRYGLQQRVNEIYAYIVNLLEGKSKLIQGKWASRKIFDSTRNVISPHVSKTDEFFTGKTVSSNQTIVGIYQYLRCIMPLAVKHVRDTYLQKVFLGPNAPAVLVNKKTLKKEMVQLDPRYYDEWMTYEGLEKIMARFGQEELRDDVLEIGNHYIGLLYRNGKSVKFVQDIDELPPDTDLKIARENLTPITFCELLYLSVFADASSIPCLLTRYPVTGYGSIYPSYVYLKTTVRADTVQVLGDDWEPIGTAYEFPIKGEQYFNAMSPSTTHVARLGADYDGDTCSLICLLSEDAKAEVKKKLHSRDYYVGVNGRMAFSAGNDIIDLVLANVTS